MGFQTLEVPLRSNRLISNHLVSVITSSENVRVNCFNLLPYIFISVYCLYSLQAVLELKLNYLIILCVQK